MQVFKTKKSTTSQCHKILHELLTIQGSAQCSKIGLYYCCETSHVVVKNITINKLTFPTSHAIKKDPAEIKVLTSSNEHYSVVHPVKLLRKTCTKFK